MACRVRPRFQSILGPLILGSLALTATDAFAQVGPPNDNFANAITLSGTNLDVVGSNTNATKEPGEPDHAGNPGGKSVWWTWQAPVSGYVTVSTLGSTSDTYGGPLDTLLAVYTGSAVNALTEVASNDDDPSTYATSRLGFVAEAGLTYDIAVDGYSYDTAADADSGTIVLSLRVSPPATNDDFANAGMLSGTNLWITGDNDTASKEPGEPDHAGNPGGKSVWWTWRAPADRFVTLSTQGSVSSQWNSELYALLGVYVGDSVSNLSVVAQDAGAPVVLRFRVDAGLVYHIAVDGYSGGTGGLADSGTILLTLNFSPGLPLAPPWGPLPDIYGNALSSTNFAGKVVVLNFWATWCPPCVAEISDLVALYKKYSVDGLVVIGVSVDSSPDGVNPPTSLVSSFASTNGMTYPVVTDRPSWAGIEASYGGINYIPTTFVLDRQNHLVAQFVGSQSYGTFEGAVLPLLYPDLTVNLIVSGGLAHLSWRVTQAAFGVESSPTAALHSWSPVALPIQSDGTTNYVDVPLGTGRCFFRLHSHPTIGTPGI